MVLHNFPPVFDKNSKILILGSFPSVKSRQDEFYYANPQNRFWKVLSNIFCENIPDDITTKTEFLLNHKIALWDVVANCDIIGSSDSTIKNIVPNDLVSVLQSAPICQIFVNGNTAKKIYDRFIFNQINQTAYPLPSTSPANARFNLDSLVASWQIILNYLR